MVSVNTALQFGSLCWCKEHSCLETDYDVKGHLYSILNWKKMDGRHTSHDWLKIRKGLYEFFFECSVFLILFVIPLCLVNNKYINPNLEDNSKERDSLCSMGFVIMGWGLRVSGINSQLWHWSVMQSWDTFSPYIFCNYYFNQSV